MLVKTPDRKLALLRHDCRRSFLIVMVWIHGPNTQVRPLAIALQALISHEGVLWSGDHLFEDVPETIEMLRSKGADGPCSGDRGSASPVLRQTS